jgi:hypothetical protein
LTGFSWFGILGITMKLLTGFFFGIGILFSAWAVVCVATPVPADQVIVVCLPGASGTYLANTGGGAFTFTCGAVAQRA